MKFLIFSVAFASMIISCKSQKFTPYDYEGQQIVFGSGGGFTGAVSEFTLMDNGQLFSGTNKEGFVDELKELDKKVVQQLFSNIEKFNLEELTLNAPGNQYHYLTIKNKNDTNKIQWGDKNANPPNELIIIFESLKQIVKRRILEK